MGQSSRWDTELYEGRHSFVWKLGAGLMEDLRARRGERILDLGCGTGQLTAAIAELGAEVVGLDASPDMIGQARQNFPKLRFVLADARSMQFEGEFDAIFSNAALHWIQPGQAVAKSMARALRSGGRVAVELGGRGNVEQIEAAIRLVLPQYVQTELPASRTWFPTVGEYALLLEGEGLEIQTAMLFDRPTKLDGERGMEQWIRQFAFYYFEALSPRQQDEAVAEVAAQLRGRLYRDGEWFADYRRLRVLARKP